MTISVRLYHLLTDIKQRKKVVIVKILVRQIPASVLVFREFFLFYTKVLVLEIRLGIVLIIGHAFAPGLYRYWPYYIRSRFDTPEVF